MCAAIRCMGAVGSEPRTNGVSCPDSATERLSRLSCSPPMRLKENSESRSISRLSAAHAYSSRAERAGGVYRGRHGSPRSQRKRDHEGNRPARVVLGRNRRGAHGEDRCRNREGGSTQQASDHCYFVSSDTSRSCAGMHPLHYHCWQALRTATRLLAPIVCHLSSRDTRRQAN